MDRIKVIVNGRTAEDQLLSATIAEQPDMEVVAAAGDSMEVLLVAGESTADVVVMRGAAGGREPGLISHLLGEYPGLSVVTVARDGGAIWRQEVICNSFGDASADGVVRAIRTAAWAARQR